MASIFQLPRASIDLFNNVIFEASNDLHLLEKYLIIIPWKVPLLLTTSNLHYYSRKKMSNEVFITISLSISLSSPLKDS